MTAFIFYKTILLYKILGETQKNPPPKGNRLFTIHR